MWQLGGFAKRSPTLDRRPVRSPGAAAQGPEMSPEMPVARLCALPEPRPPRASRSPKRAEVRHPAVDVTGERNIASQIAFGVSDRRALGILTWLLRAMCPTRQTLRHELSSVGRTDARSRAVIVANEAFAWRHSPPPLSSAHAGRAAAPFRRGKGQDIVAGRVEQVALMQSHPSPTSAGRWPVHPGTDGCW